MNSFDYRAVDTVGRECRGRINAVSAEDAKTSLTRRRLLVVAVQQSVPGSTPPLLSRRLWQSRKLSSTNLMLFTRQLATLVQVCPIEEALRTIVQQSEREYVARVIRSVHGAVIEGQRLSEAMRIEARSFPPIYRAMISAGESSGTLPQILARMADLLERQAQVRSKVITSFTYPIILTVVAFIVIFGLMVFVVPTVVEQFEDVGQSLPLLTRLVIGSSHFLANWWWALTLFCLAGVLMGFHSLRDESVRLRFDSLLLRVPLIGRMTRNLHAARLARTLSTMVASGLPLLDALKLTTETIRNLALRTASASVAEGVRTGGSLSGALRRAGIFPPILVYMAASGESAGRLDMMLERAAEYLEREFDSFTSTALSLLEPVIIIVLGGLVSVIVLSILLPILQLETLAGKL